MLNIILKTSTDLRECKTPLTSHTILFKKTFDNNMPAKIAKVICP